MIFNFINEGFYLTTFKTYTEQQRAKAILFEGAGLNDFECVLVVNGQKYFKKIK